MRKGSARHHYSVERPVVLALGAWRFPRFAPRAQPFLKTNFMTYHIYGIGNALGG